MLLGTSLRIDNNFFGRQLQTDEHDKNAIKLWRGDESLKLIQKMKLANDKVTYFKVVMLTLHQEARSKE